MKTPGCGPRVPSLTGPWLLFLVTCASAKAANIGAPPPRVDVCDMVEQEISQKKHGFLAGNNVFYIGGYVGLWDLWENETIGLTHPWFNDLRSRGTGIATYKDVGTGNDFYGWVSTHIPPRLPRPPGCHVLY